MESTIEKNFDSKCHILKLIERAQKCLRKNVYMREWSAYKLTFLFSNKENQCLKVIDVNTDNISTKIFLHNLISLNKSAWALIKTFTEYFPLKFNLFIYIFWQLGNPTPSARLSWSAFIFEWYLKHFIFASQLKLYVGCMIFRMEHDWHCTGLWSFVKRYFWLHFSSRPETNIMF